MEFSGERASGGTKQDRKASRKEIPRAPLLAEESEADDAVVVATEKRDSSPLPPGSLLRLPAEPVPLTLLIMAWPSDRAARAARLLSCGDVRRREGGCCCLDGLELESGGLTRTRHGHGEEERAGSENGRGRGVSRSGAKLDCALV